MPHVDKKAAKKFCELCNWAYEAWVTHKCLFDDNSAPANNIGRSPWFAERLSTITQEYALLQIAKLHDPSRLGKWNNASINFMIEYGAWGEQRPDVEKIASRLAELYEKILPARNKLLSHNDLETIIGDTPLGSFSEGNDEGYFDALQELVNAVHDRWFDGPNPFNDLAKADANEFLSLLAPASPNRQRK